MKRYMVFWGDDYYPLRGMEDFVGDYDELNEAISSLHRKNREERDGDWVISWGHVYDLIEKDIVYTTTKS